MHLKDKKVFWVHYHPETCPRPEDSRYLFDEFVSKLVIKLMHTTCR